MFDLAKDNGSKPHCLVTSTKLSNFLNHEQPPTKRRPFSAILDQTFTHNLTLLAPTSANTFQNALSTVNSPYTLHYAKAHFKLHEILKNPFFTTYIKSPPNDLLLISLGPNNPYTGPFTLSQGILTLDLDRPTYARTGLQGKPIAGPGKKPAKERFQIELNLRLPNMLHGKKGFERILWALENVLNETCTWLVADAKSEGFEPLLDDPTAPIMEFAPLGRKVQADMRNLGDVEVPAFPSTAIQHQEASEETAELLEWLSLAILGSPRIGKDDNIDKHFSRYQIPDAFGEAQTQGVSKFTWRGFVPAHFAYKTFLAALKASGEDWVALSGSSFTGETYTILIDGGRSIMWEYKD